MGSWGDAKRIQGDVGKSFPVKKKKKRDRKKGRNGPADCGLGVLERF